MLFFRLFFCIRPQLKSPGYTIQWAKLYPLWGSLLIPLPAWRLTMLWPVSGHGLANDDCKCITAVLKFVITFYR